MRRRAVAAAAGAACCVLLLAGCAVTPPTGGTETKTTEAMKTYPAPTSVSCATVESELATVNEIVSDAAKNFGDDPYAALDRMRGAITFLENLRDAATDVELEQLLNEVAVEGLSLIDTIDRVMHDGTLLVEFDQISDGAHRVEDRLNDLITYCRF